MKRSLTIVQIKSQVYLQQQTKQSSSRNIQELKVLGNFVSGCVFFVVVVFFLTVEKVVLHSKEHYLNSSEKKA